MDNKVKITFITAGVLLLLIISTGLYNTFNPKSSQAEVKQIVNQPQVISQGVRVSLGSKSNFQIKNNAYYFPQKKVKRVKIEPIRNENIDAQKEDELPMEMSGYFDPFGLPVDESLINQGEIEQQPQDLEQDF